LAPFRAEARMQARTQGIFATNLGSDQVLGFRLDATTGNLTPIDPPAIKVADKSGPRHFVFAPDGKFFYLLHELSGAILVFSYDDSNGTWHELQRSTALPAGLDGKPWAADIHLTPDVASSMRPSERRARWPSSRSIRRADF
jgi:6-phosphogluconolactonase